MADRLAEAPAEFELSIDPCGRPETGFDWSTFELHRPARPVAAAEAHRLPKGPGIHVIPKASLPPPDEPRLVEVFRARRVQQLVDGPAIAIRPCA